MCTRSTARWRTPASGRRCSARSSSFQGPDGQKFGLVYLYKQGTFYPFAPTSNKKRDNALELQIRGVLGDDLRIEPELGRWMALWGAPGL